VEEEVLRESRVVVVVHRKNLTEEKEDP